MGEPQTLREVAQGLDFALSFHNLDAEGDRIACLPGCIACAARAQYAGLLLASPDSLRLYPEDPESVEAEAGRLLVEAARLRSARLGPDDAHELRHLWAAINAGNSDPCGRNGEACHLDVEAIRRWTEQYPKVVGLDAREWKASAAPTEETPHE